MNMTLFKSVEATLQDKPIELKCFSYHCKFAISNIPAEANYTLKIKLELEPNMTRESFEEVIVEYWPNDKLDPVGENPHISKLEIKLDSFDSSEGVVWTDDEKTDNQEPEVPTNSKGTSILVVFSIFLLIIGICLLASKKIKEKCRSHFRLNQKTDLSAEFNENARSSMNSQNSEEGNVQSNDEDNRLFDKKDLEEPSVNEAASKETEEVKSGLEA